MSIIFNKKLETLSRNSQWTKGIKLIQKKLKTVNILEKDGLMLRFAFFLYHDSFYKKIYNINTDKNLRKSVDICRDIIRRNKKNKNNILINARIFLAQILASNGKKEALKIALGTHKIYRNSLSANRLANVYEIFGNSKKAEKYYKEHEKLSLRDKENMLYVYLNMIFFYNKTDNYANVKKYTNLINRNKKNDSYKQIKKILEQHVLKNQ